MSTLYNEITIAATVSDIWNVLSKVDELDKYDPTVLRSEATTVDNTGTGAARKVAMKDGKNWFEEKVTIFNPGKNLAFELTACSFPVHQLKHSYSFETKNNYTVVRQVMEYRMKYGLLGKLLDSLIVRKQSDKGIKQFFAGLKAYVEKNNAQNGLQ